MRLKDQVAVVTGGGGGIGEGICLCMAREGAHLVVSDVNKDLVEQVAAKVRETGRKSLAMQTDVRIASQCELLVDTTLREMGRLDILVCSAGVGGYTHHGRSTAPIGIESISEADWNETIDVNLKGVFLCNRAVIPHFKKQKKGKIVNVSSVAGRRGNELLPHYSASKAGVIVMTQAIAVHMAPYHVNANTLCPGIIWTPMWAGGVEVMSRSHPLFKGMDPKKIFDTLIQAVIPFKRAQTPEDMGNAVVFLASEEAREITGQALNVDGGMVFS
jgi:NAD(P)-dependent dehydrogenase (short-subunit alcohol dehydrogenase family)